MINTYEAITSVNFSASHRLERHQKCGCMHGHSYRVTACVAQEEPLDESGYVVDFGIFKSVLKGIVEPLDHKYIVSFENQKANYDDVSNSWIEDSYEKVAWKKNEMILLPIPRTTCEHIATFIANKLTEELCDGWKYVWVEVAESDQNSARVIVEER